MIKTKRFQFFKDTGDPMRCVRVYDAQGADELIILDISATSEGRTQWLDIIETCARECFIPLTVGGGIRNVEDARRAFASGADRISVCTEAIKNPAFLSDLSQEFGRANIVCCVDVRLNAEGQFEATSHGGSVFSGRDPVDWSVRAFELGAGEILLHSVERDGMMTGYDLELLKRVAEAVECPVMILGGAGTLDDLERAVTFGKASAVAAASIFHFTDQSPIKAHSHLRGKGIPVCLA